MEHIWEAGKAGLVMLCGLVSACLASVTGALALLVILQLMDLITALIANGKLRQLDPAVGWGGWKRKANAIFIVLALAVLQMIVYEGEAIPVTIPAAQAVAGGFAVLEFLSIVRNGILSGVKLPGFVADAFARLDAAMTHREGEETG